MTPAESIRNAILGRYPLVYLLGSEENRAMDLLEAFSAKLYGEAIPIETWDCVNGFSGAAPSGRAAMDTVAAILSTDKKGFVVLKDFSHFMAEPQISRMLREAYYKLQGKDRFVFILAAELAIPESLKKEIYLVTLGLPDENELLKNVKRLQQSYQSSLAPEIVSQIAFALRGMTLNESNHVLHRIFRSKKTDAKEILPDIFSEKEMIVKKSGYLEFVPPTYSISEIGGLDNLKDWLVKRQKLFSRQALEDGMPVPRGILLMGMSGCGKSLSAKAISALWNVPLFRLDMNLVFSGIYGSPELTFHRALQTVESVSPAVLWIDEIENSLGMDEGQSQMNSHVFSAFLTWMQEKPPLVFVAATANRIHALPAEVIRKGRFDQVFFIDLPTDEERKQIIEIHLKRNGADARKFDLVFLAAVTKQWNGAEIEQVVEAARIEAYHEGRTMSIDDITRNTSRTVPLAKTMEEQMKKIRSWAFGRATPASKYAAAPRS